MTSYSSGIGKLNAQRRAKRASLAADKWIERLYYKHCSGIQINIMDIGKVFDAGTRAIAENPRITEDQLAKVIVDFVQTIRKN
jgi:hypothetical protein